jgi:hypothetical protein
MEEKRRAYRVLTGLLLGAAALGCGGVKELIPAETYDADIECGTIKAARTPRGKDCVTAELVCGDTIVGTTEGGLSEYDDHFYSGDSFCSSLPDNYSGPERAYRFEMPANAEAVIYLDSACGGDLDLIAMRWPETDSCPNIHHSLGQCDEDDAKGDGRLELYSDKHARNFVLVVEGKDGIGGEFGIKIDCWERN